MRNILLAVVLAVLTASVVFAQTGDIVKGGEQIIDVSLPDVQQRFDTAARNLQTVSTWAEPTRTQCTIREIRIVHRYLVNRNIIKRQTISDEEIRTRLQRLGYPTGGPATWGASEVLFCLNGGLMVGMKVGSTPSSREWRAPATREQLATVVAREARMRQVADEAETQERQSADEAEKKAREEGEIILAWAVFFVCVLTGVGFVLHCLNHD